MFLRWDIILTKNPSAQGPRALLTSNARVYSNTRINDYVRIMQLVRKKRNLPFRALVQSLIVVLCILLRWNVLKKHAYLLLNTVRHSFSLPLEATRLHWSKVFLTWQDHMELSSPYLILTKGRKEKIYKAMDLEDTCTIPLVNVHYVRFSYSTLE